MINAILHAMEQSHTIDQLVRWVLFFAVIAALYFVVAGATFLFRKSSGLTAQIRASVADLQVGQSGAPVTGS